MLLSQHMQRYRNGRYAKQRMTATDRLIVLGLAAFTISCGWYIDHNSIDIAQAVNNTEIAPIIDSQIVVKGRDDDAIPLGDTTVLTTPAPTTQPFSINSEVRRVFGKDAEKAIKIMYCESGGNPNSRGDTNIMSVQSGELVGDSIGLFQVRTGGRGFNRAKSNGMTADEFRTFLRKPTNNIEYAKKVYDSQGWNAWYTCNIKTSK